MGLVFDSFIPIAVYSEDGTPTVHVPTHRVCTDGSSSSTFEDRMSFDKTLYRMFSLQDDMKILTYPDRLRTEFDLFLQAAEQKTQGAVNADFDSLDNYLGSIGVNNAGIC